MDQGEELRAFGSLLCKMREAMGLTRQELATKVGCKYEDIRLYEKGERVMRIDRLFRILNVLGIHLSKDLFDIEVYEAAAGLTCLEEKNRKNLMSKICSMIAKAEKNGEKHGK